MRIIKGSLRKKTGEKFTRVRVTQKWCHVWYLKGKKPKSHLDNPKKVFKSQPSFIIDRFNKEILYFRDVIYDYPLFLVFIDIQKSNNIIKWILLTFLSCFFSSSRFPQQAPSPYPIQFHRTSSILDKSQNSSPPKIYIAFNHIHFEYFFLHFSNHVNWKSFCKSFPISFLTLFYKHLNHGTFLSPVSTQAIHHLNWNHFLFFFFC